MKEEKEENEERKTKYEVSQKKVAQLMEDIEALMKKNQS